MSSVEVFPANVIGTQIEVDVLTVLAKWMPTNIQVIERQLGRTLGQIPPPRNYTTRNEFTSFPEDQLPLCVAVSPGLADTPTKEADGTYSAWWAVGVGFAALARDVEAAGFLSKVYGAAARGILLKWQSLEGQLSQKVIWEDESYDDLVTEDDRSVRACYELFRIWVHNVVTEYAGPTTPAVPADPDAQPGSTWPTANVVKIDAINILG